MSFDFNSGIRSWVKLDDEIRQQKKVLNELKQRQEQVTTNIIDFVNSNELNKHTIEITDGNLKFNNVSTTSPFTQKYIEKSLLELLKNPDQVKIIMDYLKSNREKEVKQVIYRKFNNE